MRWCWVAVALACAGSAQADECDVQTARVVQATGAQFDHRSPSGENVFLRHPLAREFVMSCIGKDVIGPGHVSISFDGAYPPNGYFDLVARAASASMGFPGEEARRLAVTCHRKALADAEELGEASTRTIRVECQSFRRDGGGTLIGVWPPRPE